MKIALAVGIMAFAMSTVCAKIIYDEIEDDWNLYKITYNKSYSDDNAEVFRKNVYLANKLEIDRHNKLYENGEVTFTMRMNHFGDWADREFFEKITGYKPRLGDIDRNNTFVRSENVKYPARVNWINKGYVTPVKDQTPCGACWSFSATGSLEGQYFKKTGKLVSFSEQNLIDCSRKYGNHGCRGGDQVRAFKYIINNEGIDTEESYPYRAKDDGRCQFNRRNVGATIRSYKSMEGDDNLLAALATVGPVSVSMTAIKSFKFYDEGIYQDRDCCTGALNHAVLAVGYGVAKSGAKYWLVKNSWGTDWGRKGYAFMSRDVNNMCGISIEPCYPVI